MIIALNGHELSRRAEGELTVGLVLDEVRAEILNAGKIVTRIAIDGIPLSDGAQRRRQLGTLVGEVSRLDLTIDEPSRVLHQTASDAMLTARRLAANAEALARKFRVAEEVVANQELAAYLEELKLVLSGLDLVTRGTRRPGYEDVQRQRLLDNATSMLPVLDRLYQAQAACDYVTIADGLEYELPPLITEWVSILNELVGEQEEAAV